MSKTFPLVDVSGSPYERGASHGRQVPERVAASIALYRSQLERRGVDEHRSRLLARRMMPIIEAYDANYLDEMRGIADGAGVTLEEIIIVNCRTEMMFGYEELDAAQSAKDDGDCTGLVILPQRSGTGGLLHAHNWDWREECIDSGIVLRIRRSDGPDVLTFTEAGALARHGLNSAGVSLTGNSLACDLDFKRAGNAPLVLIRRRMLESPGLNQAMTALWATTRYCANNMIAAQAGGWGVSLECAPNEIFWLPPVDGVVVHTNHWLCPVARSRLRDTRIGERPDSIYRQSRVEMALGALERAVTWDDIKEILADDFGAPSGVLRSPKPGSFASISATVATTLIEPDRGVMWIARKPYEAPRQFAEYGL
jgi:isopenicillin-N N-acyltransferase-like protein